MKLLIDESTTRELVVCFPDRFEIRTVGDLGWSGTDNGDLLRMAADAGFKALITVDKNIEYQQNLDKLPIAIIVLDTPISIIEYLEPMVPEVISILDDDPGRKFIKIQGTRNTADLNSDKQL